MSLIEGGGVLVVLIALGWGVNRYDPTVSSRVARQAQLGRRGGWLVYVTMAGTVALPVAAGAPFFDSGPNGSELWMIGSAIAAGGVFLCAVALASVDEVRALRRAAEITGSRIPARYTGEPGELVAVDGRPVPTDQTAAISPLSGTPSVHTDWIVQARRDLLVRSGWISRTDGVQTADFEFTDRGSVRIEPGRARTMAADTAMFDIPADEALPDPATTVFAGSDALPAPDDRDRTYRFIENVVPANGPVTVIGYPERIDGSAVIRSGPPQSGLIGRVLPGGFPGSETTGDASRRLGSGEPILVRGDLDRAKTLLHRRVYWFGVAGVAATVCGEALAFLLSAARLGGVL